MRKRIDETRAAIKKSTKGRQATASSGGNAACFLRLPTIAKNIPIRSVWDENGKWLKAAQLCASLVGDDELNINDSTTARDIICQALSLWASRLCADIRMLDCFELEVALQADDIGADDYDNDSDEDTLFIGFRSKQSTPMINVNNPLSKLDAQHPGFAATAFHYAQVAAYKTFTAFTPEVAFMHASYLYWYGMDDDESYLEEAKLCGEEKDEDDENEFGGGLLPSTFKSSFPDYVTGNPLDKDAIKSIASGGDEAAETAKAILAIMNLLEQDAYMPYTELTNSAYFSCCVTTGENVIPRVLDDFYENSQYSELTDLYGISDVLLDAESFQKWKDQMEKGFALYTQMDHLMRRISET